MDDSQSVDEVKLEFFQEQVNEVVSNLLTSELLKNFCLNTAKESVRLPSLDGNPNLKSYVYKMAESMGMDVCMTRDKEMVITKDSEPVRPRSHILELAPTTISILSESSRISMTEQDSITRVESKKLSTNISSVSNGSRSAGRLSLTNLPPTIGNFLGEKPELVVARRNLPIYSHRQKILDAISLHRVIMVAGDPGSGKTSQVPQYILEQSKVTQTPCRVISILPRRISVQGAFERVHEERGVTGDRLVGYHARLDSRIKPTSQIIFCTTAVFLHTLIENESVLSGVTHLIVDEVDARDRYTDLLLGYFRARLSSFTGLRLVLLSSNVATAVLSTYFFKCPVVHVSGPVKPTSSLFLEEILTCTKFLTKQDDDESAVLSETAQVCDRGLAAAWLNGNDEIFLDLQRMILDGAMPVDYQHRLTGVTLLMAAAIHGRTDIVKCLLSCGADPTLKVRGMTPFDMANEFARPEVADLLLAHMENFQAEMGDHVVESGCRFSASSEEASRAFYTKYSKERVNLQLVVEVICFALGYRPEKPPREPGTILVFLPGYYEVMEVRNILSSKEELQDQLNVVPLHSHLQMTEYRKLFRPAEPGKRKVILTTSLETAVSFKDVTCIIDSGLVRDRENDSIVVTPRKTAAISKSSAQLRSLHCSNGGLVLRLYSRSRYDAFQEFPVPEITRAPLTDLCLRARLLLPDDVRLAQFLASLPDSPPSSTVQKSLEILVHIGALDASLKVTPVGLQLVDMPVEPRFGKMILAALMLKCMDPVVTIVCCLSRDDPFVTPPSPDQRRRALDCKLRLSRDCLSDHLSLLKAYLLWEQSSKESHKRLVCNENYLSVIDFELIFILRVQLVGELRASGFIRNKGQCDVRSLNVHCESFAAIKAALAAGLYPNVGHYSLASGGVATHTEARAQFHFTSTLLPQESRVQDWEADSYFGPPFLGKMDPPSIRAGLMTCPWIMYQDVEKFGGTSILRCCTVITPATALLFSGHSKLPTVQLIPLDAEEHRRLLTFLNGDGGDSDEMTEEEIRSVCEELAIAHLSDQMVRHNAQVRAEKQRRAAHERRVNSQRYVLLKIDDFIAFKMDRIVATWMLNLRQKFQVLLEKCACEPGCTMSPAEESLVKTVLHVLSSEETAMQLPQPGSGIGHRPSNVSTDSILAMPDFRPDELYLIKRYETYHPPPPGHRFVAKTDAAAAETDAAETNVKSKATRLPAAVRRAASQISAPVHLFSDVDDHSCLF